MDVCNAALNATDQVDLDQVKLPLLAYISDHLLFFITLKL